jgi:hypothetical protein
MGMAPVAHVLFNKIMNYNPKNAKWINRDRFVLSWVSLFFSDSQIAERHKQSGFLCLATTRKSFRRAWNSFAAGSGRICHRSSFTDRK